MVTEALMDRSLQINSLNLRPMRRMSGHSRHDFSLVIPDGGDDHEIAEAFGNSLTRASDRIVGFLAGAGVLAVAWVVWVLI